MHANSACRSADCGKLFPGEVAFCPYCGHDQVKESPRMLISGPAIVDKKDADTALPADTSPPLLETQGQEKKERVDRTLIKTDVEKIGWSIKKQKLAGVGLLITGGLFAAVIAMQNRPAGAPGQCVEPVAMNTVIVIDSSGALSANTLDVALARAMAHIREKVQVNERVSLFDVSDASKGTLSPVLSLCKGPAKSVWTASSRENGQQPFEANFIAPIRHALSIHHDRSKETPIAHSLTDLSLSSYLRGSSNTLLIFSDMLEHTPRFSLFDCASPGSVARVYRESQRGAKEQPEFKNTNVIVNLIPRAGQKTLTIQCRDFFWKWFFSNSDGPGTAQSFDYLPAGVTAERSTQGSRK